MKSRIQKLLAQAMAAALPEVDLPGPVQVERSRDPGHGDFASNLAMTLARAAGRPPRELASALVAALPASEGIARVEIAGPGFINFFLNSAAHVAVVREVLAAGSDYGRSHIGAGQRVLVEFVSANPTGPLHVGHGRGAAYGDCVARLLASAGFDVHREYYVNDAGRQMDILAVSLWARYLEACGEHLPFPAGGYQGDYVVTAAQQLWGDSGDDYRHPAAVVLASLPADADVGGDANAYLDALIGRARELLGTEGFLRLLDTILGGQLDDIAADLTHFRVHYDRWFSERGLVAAGAVDAAVRTLRAEGHTYDAEGATWFAATRFGDEKDRVLVRANGNHTYFAADIAYHLHKLERGYTRLVDIWGADHHGYVARLKAAVAALTGVEDRLAVQLVQFAVLYRGSEKQPMSTRAGQYVTLKELFAEVGVDAARLFYVMRSHEQHLDFDLELATARSNENPVYYIQYAHARVCSVARQLGERGWVFALDDADLARLDQDQEQRLLTALARYPEVVEAAAVGYTPHGLAHFLRETADHFHSYYNAHMFLVEDAALRNARLALVLATRQLLANGLELLGVQAPEAM